MSDSIGNIIVPEISASGTFPLIPDQGYGYSQPVEVYVHQFGSANAKIEQRFLAGTGTRRFSFRRAVLSTADREALREFWEGLGGPYGAFTYNAPSDDGASTEAVVCRFENAPLAWQMIADAAASLDCILVEIPDPGIAPTYALNNSLERFPDGTLTPALLAQPQHVIPLLKITPREPDYPEIRSEEHTSQLQST